MVTITETASRKLTELLAQQPQPVAGLRLSVQQGGCSGFSYGMSFADAEKPGDWVGEFGGVKVLVDADSAPILAGVNVDYVETLQATGFTINNPNAVSSCGCGKSFETQGESSGTSGSSGSCGSH